MEMTVSIAALDVAHRMTREAGDCLCLARELPDRRDHHRALAVRYLEQAADVLGYRLAPKQATSEREHVASAAAALGDEHATVARAA